ncbi:MAG: sugar transferase [Bryobacteraceae bacterium]
MLIFAVLERVAAAAALLILAPGLGVIAVFIALKSGRFPFVAHQRVGRRGDRFWMWKLRTMWKTPFRVADESLPPAKQENDPRVEGSLARWLRQHSIDELPQLAHVVTGRMSLVGPRPLTRQELDTYYGHSASELLAARPGLTGLWQVMGRSRLTYAQRRRLDLFLVRHYCARLYLRLLWRTIPQVLRGADAW